MNEARYDKKATLQWETEGGSIYLLYKAKKKLSSFWHVIDKIGVIDY